MAMLAERKTKRKWCLNPRGNSWSQDSNRIGQKLMEKMGWTHGKGLGANEDGSKEHIKVSIKNDTKGMGFKETTEKWTENEEQYADLLRNLSKINDETFVSTSSTASGSVPAQTTVSLEQKSQSSRARLHYKKFTRGKDLSRYSSKDLANIFGKPAPEVKPAEDRVSVELPASGSTDKPDIPKDMIGRFKNNKKAIIEKYCELDAGNSKDSLRSKRKATNVLENIPSKLAKYDLDECTPLPKSDASFISYISEDIHGFPSKTGQNKILKLEIVNLDLTENSNNLIAENSQVEMTTKKKKKKSKSKKLPKTKSSDMVFENHGLTLEPNDTVDVPDNTDIVKSTPKKTKAKIISKNRRTSATAFVNEGFEEQLPQSPTIMTDLKGNCKIRECSIYLGHFPEVPITNPNAKSDPSMTKSKKKKKDDSGCDEASESPKRDLKGVKGYPKSKRNPKLVEGIDNPALADEIQNELRETRSKHIVTASTSVETPPMKLRKRRDSNVGIENPGLYLTPSPTSLLQQTPLKSALKSKPIDGYVTPRKSVVINETINTENFYPYENDSPDSTNSHNISNEIEKFQTEIENNINEQKVLRSTSQNLTEHAFRFKQRVLRSMSKESPIVDFPGVCLETTVKGYGNR